MSPEIPEIVFEHAAFDFETLEEEIRVDEQCRLLLQQFYGWLQKQNLTLQQASNLAYCADYYLRDYVFDFLHRNVLRPQPGQVRYFAANWYITRTLEPEITVFDRHLKAISELYRFLLEIQLISSQELAGIEQEVALQDYYHQRIESFLALAGDGYEQWDKQESMIVHDYREWCRG